jgi:catechol 2,3-dioxygenase-like lactoylglutathione lyase family enzyme
MVIDHVSLYVSDFAKSRSFFVEALAPLDLHIVAEGDDWALMGREGRGGFLFRAGDPASSPIHIAFAALTREDVQRFHKAGLGAGGRDNGAPGIRAHYSPNYYGAFVIGPDGHNVEAVTRSAV